MSDLAQQASMIYTEVYESDRIRGGHALIVKGRHDRADVEAAVTYNHGDGWDRVIIEEQHLWYQRRVMWCERYGAMGCDMEGEWHGHYHPVKPNPVDPDGALYTVALPIWERAL